jgi:RimJ/RimL family protein N-acetyltransferase
VKDRRPSAGVLRPDSNPQIEIRRSTPDDFAAFWTCLDSVARERRFLAMVEAPPQAEARAFLERARADGMIQYVATDESSVIGWCDITPVHWEGFRHSGRLGMGVAAPFRGQGVGTQLLLRTLEAVRDAGLTRIELEVFRTNTVAVALYARHGFVEEGIKRAARVIDGVTDDVICMARVFSGLAAATRAR